VDLTPNIVVEGHPKVLVSLTATHFHCTGSVFERTFMLMAWTLDHSIHNLGHDMTDFQIIDTPADCDLLTPNHFVCHARIVRIDDEANACQTFGKLPTA
jgi:hypothetical protein